MILIIIGTRPEAIKVRSIVLELKRRKVAFTVVATGQHQDLLEGTGIKPDVFLKVASENDPLAYVESCVTTLTSHVEMLIHVERAKWVAVQGDTASALAGARWAVAAGIPVCHVEAGLRSHCLEDPWPEEQFRIEIDQLSELCCCPTEGNLRNIPRDDFYRVNRVTGNTITDALRLSGVARTPGSHVLVTLHRRESFGQPLRDIISGLSTFATTHPLTPILWPTHPNPQVQEILRETALPTNVLTRGPLPYQSFLALLSSAKAVLTDSGGVLEEATTLGIPVAIARQHTERPESTQIGSATLCGTSPENVLSGLEWAFTAAIEPSSIYGDGFASSRICDLLA